eukprot:g1615.t1
MTRQAALKAPRILPDLTAKSADFARKLGEVLDPVVWYHLSRRYPDGVRIAEIADWHQLLFCEAVDIVKAAEAAGHMKARRAPDGSIRFVWLTGTMPPLSSLENLILRRAQQDLFEGGSARISKSVQEKAGRDVMLKNRYARQTLALFTSARAIHRDPSRPRGLAPGMIATEAGVAAGGAAKRSGKHKVMSGGWMADYDNCGKIMICDITWTEVMDLVAGCLTEDADVYAFANDKNQFEAQRAAYAAGLKFHNLLAWDKRTATANRWYMKNLEFILYLYTGRARAIANCSDKQLVPFPHRDVTNHPTEKPVPLVEAYIRNSARPGEAVIDPFMGSGTAAVACARTGNPFVGVEIDPKHFETACRRVERVCEGLQCDLEGFLASDTGIVQ